MTDGVCSTYVGATVSRSTVSEKYARDRGLEGEFGHVLPVG